MRCQQQHNCHPFALIIFTLRHVSEKKEVEGIMLEGITDRSQVLGIIYHLLTLVSICVSYWH